MIRVDTTDSSTPASTRALPDSQWRAEIRSRLRRAGCWVAGVWMLGMCAVFATQAGEAVLEQSALQRTPDALYLSARIQLVPSPPVEDALLKGVPLYFVWQADLYRDRWYWTDKRVSSAMRTLRLAYQPLTRRWRLSVSTDPEANRSSTGLQYALHQSFDTFSEAMGGVSRVVRWRVADTASLSEGSDERVEMSFRLDLGLLPRPFQIGVANESDWLIEVKHRLNVPVLAEPDPAPAVPSEGAGATNAAAVGAAPSSGVVHVTPTEAAR